MWLFNRKKRILIVEDNKVMRALTMRRVENMKNYEPIAASNLEEAIVAILEEKPDYLFLDIKLKDENGFDLLKMMQNNELPFVPTLITTSDKKMGSLETALELGAFDYLIKPFSTIDIKTKLKRFAA